MATLFIYVMINYVVGKKGLRYIFDMYEIDVIIYEY